MKSYRPERVEATDPHRCHFMTNRGQCNFKQVDQSNYCPMHGGNKVDEANEKKALALYRLGKWQARIADFALNREAKSLKEEVGILRILLEERLNICNDNTDLMIHSAAIGELVSKIAVTVKLLHNLDISIGKTLDKNALTQFANELIATIGKYVSDPEALENIADELEASLNRAGNVFAQEVL